MRQRASLGNQRVALIGADEAVEQTVPVDMARLFAVAKKADAAQPMNAHAHPGPSADRAFDYRNRPKPPRAKERGRRGQQRVENLRRAGNSRQPLQPVNDEFENQSSLFSTGARSATDGPFRTFPSASKREPWQGQSHVVSVRFQCTMHFKCGQTAVISWSAPASSR